MQGGTLLGHSVSVENLLGRVEANKVSKEGVQMEDRRKTAEERKEVLARQIANQIAQG